MIDNTIAGSEPGDIYADENGKLWRILSVVREPMVEAEEVEGTLHDPADAQQMSQYGGRDALIVGGIMGSVISHRSSIVKHRRRGHLGADLWGGFVRIWRKA